MLVTDSPGVHDALLEEAAVREWDQLIPSMDVRAWTVPLAGAAAVA